MIQWLEPNPDLPEFWEASTFSSSSGFLHTASNGTATHSNGADFGSSWTTATSSRVTYHDEIARSYVSSDSPDAYYLSSESASSSYSSRSTSSSRLTSTESGIFDVFGTDSTSTYKTVFDLITGETTYSSSLTYLSYYERWIGASGTTISSTFTYRSATSSFEDWINSLNTTTSINPPGTSTRTTFFDANQTETATRTTTTSTDASTVQTTTTATSLTENTVTNTGEKYTETAPRHQSTFGAVTTASTWQTWTVDSTIQTGSVWATTRLTSLDAQNVAHAFDTITTKSSSVQWHVLTTVAMSWNTSAMQTVTMLWNPVNFTDNAITHYSGNCDVIYTAVAMGGSFSNFTQIFSSVESTTFTDSFSTDETVTGDADAGASSSSASGLTSRTFSVVPPPGGAASPLPFAYYYPVYFGPAPGFQPYSNLAVTAAVYSTYTIQVAASAYGRVAAAELSSRTHGSWFSNRGITQVATINSNDTLNMGGQIVGTDSTLQSYFSMNPALPIYLFAAGPESPGIVGMGKYTLYHSTGGIITSTWSQSISSDTIAFAPPVGSLAGDNIKFEGFSCFRSSSWTTEAVTGYDTDSNPLTAVTTVYSKYFDYSPGVDITSIPCHNSKLDYDPDFSYEYQNDPATG